MATETSTEAVNTSTEETSGQEDNTNTGTETQAASAPENTNQGQESTTQDDNRLPEDHPLVTAYERQKQVNSELKAKADQVTTLETKLTELEAKATEAEAVLAKYNRLEAFLTSLGGPISKALDSKSFSTALFESDTDVKDLVAQWHKDNPSATSSALNSGGGTTTNSTDMNALLRSAAR